MDIRGSNLRLPQIERALSPARHTYTQTPDAPIGAIIEALPDAVLIVSGSHDVVAHNEAFAELWDLPEGWARLPTYAERMGYLIRQVTSPNDFLAEIEAAGTNPGLIIHDTFTLRDDRTIERYSASYPAGGMGGRVWSYRDITAHIRSEREFRVLKYVAESLNQELIPERALQRGLVMLCTLLEAVGAWIWVLGDDGRAQLVASHNAPPNLDMGYVGPEHYCECLEHLRAGRLSSMSKIVHCHRLAFMNETVDGQRHHLSLPVRVGRRTVGLLNVIVPPEKHFHEEDLRLFQAVTDQFGIAFERMRLFAAERNQRLAAETLSEAANIISSSLDLPTVLQYISDLAVALVGADSAAIGLLSADGESLKVSYAWNLPDDIAGARLPRGVGSMWATIASGIPEWIDDYAAFEGAYPPAVAAGIHAALSVSLVAGDTCLGALSVYRKAVTGPFARRDLVVLDAIGRQAGIAIQHARHYEAARRRAAELAALHTTLGEITAELDLDALLCAIVARAISLLRGSSGELALYDEASGHLRVLISQGLERDYAGTHLMLGEGVMGHVAATRQPLIVEDYASWEGHSPRYQLAADETVLAVPLLAGERLVGVFTVGEQRSRRSFDEEDIGLLTLFAQQATIAIQNARRFGVAQELSSTDALTGLTNRRHFFSVARATCAHATRSHQNFAVLMLDIDHFKRINDTYGHPAGDTVLRVVAERCRTLCRQGDLIARYGGEEFIVLLAPTSDWIATHVARRLRDAITATPIAAGRDLISVTLSIGVAFSSEDATDLDELIAAADRALYQAKRSGRNRVVIAGAETVGM